MLKPTFAKRFAFFLFSDLLLSLLSLYLAYALRFNFAIEEGFLDHFWRVYAVLTGLKVAAFIGFRIYWRSWRFFGLQDLKRLVLALVLSYAGFAVIFMAVPAWFNPMPRSAIMIDFLLSLFLLGGLRILRRALLETGAGADSRRALLIGANALVRQV